MNTSIDDLERFLRLALHYGVRTLECGDLFVEFNETPVSLAPQAAQLAITVPPVAVAPEVPLAGPAAVYANPMLFRNGQLPSFK